MPSSAALCFLRLNLGGGGHGGSEKAPCSLAESYSRLPCGRLSGIIPRPKRLPGIAIEIEHAAGDFQRVVPAADELPAAAAEIFAQLGVFQVAAPGRPATYPARRSRSAAPLASSAEFGRGLPNQDMPPPARPAPWLRPPRPRTSRGGAGRRGRRPRHTPPGPGRGKPSTSLNLCGCVTRSEAEAASRNSVPLIERLLGA